jgi:hypothetical protein
VSVSRKVFAAEGRWLMGRVVPHQLLRGIDRHLTVIAPDRRDELTGRIEARAAELVEEDGDLAVDGAAKGMLAMSATVLAGYEALLPELDGDERRTILFLQHVFGEVLERTIDVVIAALARGDEPLDAVEKAMRRSSGMYGSYFDFDFDRTDPDNFEMRVSRCLFRDFFARHNALLVTTVLCSWDANWMKALDPAVTGLRSERTTLLSLGDDACRFLVAKTDDPLASYEDALQRRFVEDGP